MDSAGEALGPLPRHHVDKLLEGDGGGGAGMSTKNVVLVKFNLDNPINGDFSGC